ncbi:alpha/beta fold hydrolase [Streptomyces sp. ML-6]|uniref:thioesterase II family protein n=1 Tax=Streptomyces sp. ML-6 TaxID=2982693 RepID=UPI0024C01B4A|nr:alpha/beta fold hydrolase [Streptomyces sp. ML-6]MDK0517988.1 alpha/beta fold hydrolase [Streptomyces sp. ML-6]
MSSNLRVEMRNGYLTAGSAREPGLRVFFFAHAGGSGISLLPLASELPDGAESVLIDLPGRGARDGDAPFATFDEARRAVARQVEPLLDRPTIFFGHSLGGLLCDSVLRSLPRGRRDHVRKVIVSSAPSPRRAAAAAAALPAPPLRRSRETLLSHLTGYGGTPAAVLDDPELLAGVIRTFGDDMLLMDSYRLEATLPVPEADYELWNGREDTSAEPDEPEEWAEALAHPVRERVFPGGHFYLTERTEARATLRHIAETRLRGEPSPSHQEALT